MTIDEIDALGVPLRRLWQAKAIAECIAGSDCDAPDKTQAMRGLAGLLDDIGDQFEDAIPLKADADA